MANVKTAISLQDSLFEQVEALAHEMNISRSHLFILAIEDFIERHQNRNLLKEINAAYEDTPDRSEQELRQQMRPKHKRLIEGEW